VREKVCDEERFLAFVWNDPRWVSARGGEASSPRESRCARSH
jgi:hypothetical protein